MQTKREKIKDRLRRAIGVATGAMLVAATATGLSAQTVDLSQSDLEIAKDVAPQIYFHPDERYFPVRYTWFIQNSTLKDKNGNVIASNMNSVSDLAAATTGSSDEYLSLDDDARVGNLSNALLYTNVATNGTYTDVVFWVAYAYNGCAMFRGKFYSSWYTSSKKRTFEWCNFGRHEKDTENLTVRIRNSDGKVLGAYLASHGDQKWYDYDELSWSGNTRPVAYVALNTHGFWPSKAHHRTNLVVDSSWGWLLNLFNVRAGWLYTVDSTSTSELEGFDKSSYIHWDAQGDVYEFNENGNIVQYNGRWGDVMNNGNVKDPTGNVPNVNDDSLESMGQYLLDTVGFFDNLFAEGDIWEGNNGKAGWKKDWYDGNF